MVCEALLATSHLPSCMHARTPIKQSMLIARHTIISAYTLLFVLILPCSVGCGSSLVRPDTTKRHRHDTAYPSRRRSSSPTTPCHVKPPRDWLGYWPSSRPGGAEYAALQATDITSLPACASEDCECRSCIRARYQSRCL
jgi:hypothetical protein